MQGKQQDDAPDILPPARTQLSVEPVLLDTTDPSQGFSVHPRSLSDPHSLLQPFMDMSWLVPQGGEEASPSSQHQHQQHQHQQHQPEQDEFMKQLLAAVPLDPSMAGNQANFPFSQPGQQDQCSSHQGLWGGMPDLSGVWV